MVRHDLTGDWLRTTGDTMVRTDDPLDSDRRIICYDTDSYFDFNKHMEEGELNSLKFIHLNIRSYYKNFDNFLIMLQASNVKFDVIVLSEAWLDENKAVCELDDYDVYYTTDTWNRNDGIVVYVRTVLDANSTQTKIGDSTGLQINFTIDNNNYSVLALYRSPAMSIELFIRSLKDYYKEMSRKTTYLLIGDMNIDTCMDSEDFYKDIYLNALYSCGLTSCIDKPTRVTDHSRTCIDHIFTNHCDPNMISTIVFKTSITDHFVITAKIDLPKRNVTDTNCIRSTYVDNEELGMLIREQAWDPILALMDVNDCCEAFLCILESLKNKATKCKYNSTRFKKIKPWITLDLIRKIRFRDKVSKVMKRRPFDLQFKRYYTNYRNNLNKEIKNIKNEYYKNKILQCAGDSKQFWGVVNEIRGVEKKKPSFPVRSFLQQQNVTDDSARNIANSFNDHFITVGAKLANALPPRTGPPLIDDAAFRAGGVFRLCPVSERQVEQCIRELRGGSAPGIDNLSVNIFKTFTPYLLQPMTYIVNLSINAGTFPDCLKIARVIPLYKCNEKNNFNNYRPISLLCVLSKVLEKCVKKQLVFYLENNNIISQLQFGFRTNKNTSDALFSLNKDIMSNVNNNLKSLLVFIDLAKAFDSIDRNKLYSKLYHIGVRDDSLKWFKSYLSGRRQTVAINNYHSDVREYDYGVVQGSTLGPTLFLIYINNLDKVRISGQIYMFADDTSIIFNGPTWNDLFLTAERDLSLIKRWFDENILTMNVKKTKIMPIALRRGAEPPAHLDVVVHTCTAPRTVTCTCQPLEKVLTYKYLGVIFDSQLRWEAHLNYLKSKLRKFIYLFYQLGPILNLKEFKTVYCAYAQSVLQYGIISWGGAHTSLINPLFVIQKLLIKAGLQKPKHYPSNLLFKDARILTIRQLYIRNLLLYIYANKEALITPVPHDYPTRYAQSGGGQPPQATRTINFTNAYYNANILHRNVPPQIRDLSDSAARYKVKVTDWLLGIDPESADELLNSPYQNL